MLSKLLPSELYHMISSKFNLTSIYEVRIRRNMPICVNVSGSYRQLRDQRENKIIFADKRLIDYILLRATESSLYCYNNQLKSFYISAIYGTATIARISSPLRLSVTRNLPSCRRD